MLYAAFLVAPDFISDIHRTSSITFIFDRTFLQVIFFFKTNILLFIYLVFAARGLGCCGQTFL